MVGSDFTASKWKGALLKDDYKSFNLGNNTQHYVLPNLKSSTNQRKEITKEFLKMLTGRPTLTG